MSPLEDGYVVRDKDSFFRDERGLLSMPHLTAFLSSMLGIVLGISGLFAFFLTQNTGSIMLLQISAGLVAAGAGLEGWQTTVEGKNQRTTNSMNNTGK